MLTNRFWSNFSFSQQLIIVYTQFSSCFVVALLPPSSKSFTCTSCVCVGFLQVLWSLATCQNILYYQVDLCACECVHAQQWTGRIVQGLLQNHSLALTRIKKLKLNNMKITLSIKDPFQLQKIPQPCELQTFSKVKNVFHYNNGYSK